MLTMRAETEAFKSNPNPNPEMIIEGTTQKVSLYEQCREERIKENLQRMQNLGLLNLAQKLKPETRPVKRPFGISNSAQKSTPPLHPSRRSSRLEHTTPVVYTDGVHEKVKRSKRERVVIYEGTRLEIYTEEHEKLLGNTERSWDCFVDGYGKDGKRIYDPVKGKTCHQCRQKTLGHRTSCCECGMVQGQFCGDCLYMRYGEHVLEALENPNWICPVCRGICNCSLCRNHKGWVPTGPIYRRIAKLGYKSVAHYLIQTKRAGNDDEDDDATPNQASAKRSLSFQEAKPLLNLEDVPKIQPLKTEEDENVNENPNSAKRALSFLLLTSADDQTSSVDAQAKEHYDLVSYVSPVDNKALVVVEETKTGSNLAANTRETRSKRKASLEPTNPDSIGARLRQRRRSSSFLLLTSADDQTSSVDDAQAKEHYDLVSYVSPVDNKALVVVEETKTGSNSAANTRETRSKRKASLEPTNPDSIGARLRQRRRSQSVV